MKVNTPPECKEQIAGGACKLHAGYIGSAKGKMQVGRAGFEQPRSSPCSAHGGEFADSC